MTKPAELYQRDRTWQPPALTPNYKTSVTRSPQYAMISLQNSPSEITGPTFGHGDIELHQIALQKLGFHPFVFRDEILRRGRRCLAGRQGKSKKCCHPLHSAASGAAARAAALADSSAIN